MRAIIFDFDGTIGDSFKVFIEVAHEITHKEQLVQPEEVARLRKLRLLDVVRELRIPRWRWPFLMVIGRHRMGKRLHEIEVFPGIEEVLSHLKHDRYQLFIMSSNSAHTIEKFLSEHGLGNYFTKVYGGIGLLSKAKALRKILRDNKIKPVEAVYVGDEPRDIDAAHQVGMISVAVAWGFNAPELLMEHVPMVVVRKPEQLLHVLEEWGKRVIVSPLVEITVEKMVHGGQALGTLADGQKVFVWNALPGETVRARIIKKKRSYAEAIAEEIVVVSAERAEPKDANYLATSPWQIMNFAAENEYKKSIVNALFEHEKVTMPAINGTVHDDRDWAYRNKMEYSFWGDDDGIHLALHQRGSHGKQIVTGSALAMPAVDAAANVVCAQLSALATRAGDLKTIIIRCDQAGNAVGALFTKLEKFSQLELPPELKGLRVYHSNPKSPASVPTKLLYELGDTTLHDRILGHDLVYDPISFFQANLPVFEQAVQRVNELTKGQPKVDFYSGVGAIGLSVEGTRALIEIDPAAAGMARLNVAERDIKVIEASAETALDYIPNDATLIVDPPRAGLHNRVIERILEAKPPQLVYLSCNPATHARDLKLLEAAYKVTHFEVYNFFPRTPHIETLAVLNLL